MNEVAEYPTVNLFIYCCIVKSHLRLTYDVCVNVFCCQKSLVDKVIKDRKLGTNNNLIRSDCKKLCVHFRVTEKCSKLS